MKKSKSVLLGVFLVLLAVGALFYFQNTGGPSAVESFPPYSQAAFDQAQKEGKLVAVNFHATWCGNCKLQALNLKRIIQENPDLGGLVVFHADFDDTKDLQESLGVEERTQILLFKEFKEVGRIKNNGKDAILEKLKAAMS